MFPKEIEEGQGYKLILNEPAQGHWFERFNQYACEYTRINIDGYICSPPVIVTQSDLNEIA